METNFTISVGNRICFDVIIVDDDVIEYMKDYYAFKMEHTIIIFRVIRIFLSETMKVGS